jgi:hypothetical protein
MKNFKENKKLNEGKGKGDNSNLKLVFYFITFINFALLQIFLKFGPLSGEKKFKFNPMGLIFLTNQVNLMLSLYFSFRLLSVLFQSDNLKKKLDSLSGFLLNCAFFIFAGYYILVHGDASIDHTRFWWWNLFMHWIHLISFLFPFIESFILSSEKHNYNLKFDVVVMFFYYIFYTGFSFYSHSQNEKWAYPFLNRMEFYQIIIFHFGMMISSVLVCFGINLWGKFISKFMTK